MKLYASRAFWLVAYLRKATKCCLMRIRDPSQRWGGGGVARRGVYDNMKTAVDKVKKGKERVVTVDLTWNSW